MRFLFHRAADLNISAWFYVPVAAADSYSGSVSIPDSFIEIPYGPSGLFSPEINGRRDFIYIVQNLSIGFSTVPAAANYALANLGQLAAVAESFYQRISPAGYDVRQSLIDHRFSPTRSLDRPRNPGTPSAEYFVPANLGQVKLVYIFDLSGFATSLLMDSDGDEVHDVADWGNGMDINEGGGELVGGGCAFESKLHTPI